MAGLLQSEVSAHMADGATTFCGRVAPQLGSVSRSDTATLRLGHPTHSPQPGAECKGRFAAHSLPRASSRRTVFQTVQAGLQIRLTGIFIPSACLNSACGRNPVGQAFQPDVSLQEADLQDARTVRASYGLRL
jgi:hypothetical protein